MSRPQGTVDEVRVVLYTRDGCHLCSDARTVVDQVCAQAGVAWREVDIDVGDRAPDAPTGAAASEKADELDPRDSLVARYGDYVPVVEVDGVQQGFWRVDAARLARRLAG